MKHTISFPDNKTFLTDGGLETTLIFHQGLELRYFAAFELLNTPEGKEQLRKYYEPYFKIAGNHKAGFVLETPTWRANPDWGYRMGYTHDELMAVNEMSVAFVRVLAKNENLSQVVISGNIGPRGDGYRVENKMSAEEAMAYHASQINAFAKAGADIVTVLTMNYAEEAIGIALAASKYGMPCVISFTVETDGALPSGQSLSEAILQTEEATGNYPLHYMINCAHPAHFKAVLEQGSAWASRIKGIRANASTKSHAELDEATELDIGDAHLLASDYIKLRQAFPSLQIFGGCCGTDHRHLEEICKHLFGETST